MSVCVSVCVCECVCVSVCVSVCMCVCVCVPEGMHAHPEGHLQVLATPDVHTSIIGSNLKEILCVYGKQSSSHCGGLDLSTGKQQHTYTTMIAVAI